MDLSNIIFNILSLPTVPTRESWIRQKCELLCKSSGIPFFTDNIGNLWVNAESLEDINSKETVFVSHMDHPGIVIDKIGGGKALGRWKGGGPAHIEGLPITLFSNAREKIRVPGKVLKQTDGKGEPDQVLLEVPDQEYPDSDYGADLATIPDGYEIKAPYLYGEKLDDLISVCVLLNLAVSVRQDNYAIMLTRAEETDLLGATKFLQENEISKDVLVISLDVTNSETSNVPLGKGMVIRYGDHETAIASPIIHNLEEIAGKIPDLNWQVLGTSAGTTELTAFVKYGYKVGALSLPVKDMHDRTEGEKYSPEVAHIGDILNLDKFLKFMVQQPKNSK